MKGSTPESNENIRPVKQARVIAPDDSTSESRSSTLIEKIRNIRQTKSSMQSDLSHEKIVTFNVGGVIFQTLESTLKFPKKTAERLLDSEMLERHWDEHRSMYFFDRDPAVFQTVLNYIRTGVLHLPHNMCSPQITSELMYWGLPRIEIQPCCWKDYSFGIQSLENLRKLESDRRPVYLTEIKAPITDPQKLTVQVWNLITDTSSSIYAKIYGWTCILVILASIVTFCISTLPQYHHSNVPHPYLEGLELIFVVFFFIDLALHLITMPNSRYYLLTFEGLIDIASLFPDLLSIVVETLVSSGMDHKKSSMDFVRSLRALRIFRLFRRVKTLWIILYTLKASVKDFLIMLVLFMVTVIIISGIMFHLEENEVFTSIPRTFWWGIITMTTVGYGDMVPQSIPGKVLGSIAAFVGVITLGLTVPTLSHNFISFSQNLSYMTDKEEYHSKVQTVRRCSTNSFV